MRCADEHEAERFPRRYLQQSLTYKNEPRKLFSSFTFDEPDQNARWESQLREVDRVDRILRKKKSELLEIDAVLVDRRNELDEVMHKRKMAEARLKRAEEDAGVIEQRAAETSVELVRASNQMINLELKAKELTEKRDQITKSVEAKTKELDDIQKSCNELKQNLAKVNSDLKGRSEELNTKENDLKDVESRLQMSLRVEELRQQVVSIEREERNQTKKYVTALKEGEQALEEKTAELARTRNDLHSQMIKFHDVNSKITKSRAELENIQLHITKGRKEIKQLSEQREEDNTIQKLKVKEAQAKLEEINKARGDCMAALKKQREEFTLLRKKSNEIMTKINNLEESKKQKEDELAQLLSLLGDREREFDKLKTDLDKNHAELETIKADVKSEKKTLEDLLSEFRIQEKHKNLLNQQEEMQKEVVLLENEVNRLKCERKAEQESGDQVAAVVKKLKHQLAATEEELSTTSIARDRVTQELAAVERVLEERKDQLNRVNEEIKAADENLQAATNNFTIAQEKHEHYIKEMQKMVKELDKMHYVEAKGSRFNEENESTNEAEDDRGNKTDNDSLVTRLQSHVKRVMAENREKTAALQDARNEFKELKSLIAKERETNHEYFVQMASKAEMYQQQFDRLQMIYEAEKLRNANEKAALLSKTEQHQLKAKRLSEELRSLRQNNLQTKQDINELKETLANDVKILGCHIETVTSQMRSELALTLKEAEKLREHALDELREDQGEMQVRLVAIQHSIDTAVQKNSQVTEQRRSAGPRSQREDAVWKNERVKLQRHQTYLRAQIRQQMSTRAEMLDEERKKAEGSLAGLKNKLKNLEEVISRKDASIQDFRLKLMTSKLETEREADSNKQIDQLRKRLQEVEDEKDLITHQRNYFVKLRTDATLDIDEIRTGQHTLVVPKNRTTTRHLRRSLDSLIGVSSSVRQWDLLQDLQGASNLHGEFRSNDGVQLQTSLAAEFQDKASRSTHQSLTESSALTRSDLSRKTTNNTHRSLTSRTVISSDLSPSTARNLLNYSDELSRTRWSKNGSNHGEIHDVKRAEKGVIEASKPSYGRKTITPQDAKRNIKGHQEPSSNSTQSLCQGSRSSPASSFANKKKSEFLIAVRRLKNEKVKQLESTFKKLALT